MRRLMVLFATAALVFGGVACGDDDPETADQTTDGAEDIYGGSSPTAASAADTDADVNIVDFGFEPKELTVATGEEVAWSNTGEASHTVTFKEGGIDSGNLQPGADFSQKFETAGTTEYFCAMHGEERMSGKIVVE